MSINYSEEQFDELLTTSSMLNEVFTAITKSKASPKIKVEFTVKDKVKVITPGLNRVFGNPYEIEVVRYIPHDE